MGIKKELTKLIASDEIEKAIKNLISYTESTGQDDLNTNTILLSSRYNRNEKNVKKGLLTNDNYNMELNRIISALKDYVNSDLEAEEEEVEENEAKEEEKPKTSNKTVFISYSHSEAKYAKKMHKSLNEKGVDVVIDYEDLSAGKDIKSFIENSIKNASNTISIVSSRSLLSSWVSIEVIRTMHSEKISNKNFIAAFIDDSFFKRSFTNDALDKIELEIADIQKEMDERRAKNRNIDDLYSELKRYNDLQHHLPQIVQRLKESYSVDIRDDAFEDGIQQIADALI